MLLSYVFRFDLYRLADTERLETGACGSPYWWLLHWSSGLDLEGGALLPGVLCSLEGGALLPGVLYSLECSSPWREVLYSLEYSTPWREALHWRLVEE